MELLLPVGSISSYRGDSYDDSYAASFDGTTGLYADAAITADNPMTLGCWMKSAGTGVVARTLVAVGDSGSSVRWNRIATNIGDTMVAQSQFGGGIASAVNATNWADSNPHFVVGVFAAAASRTIYVDDAASVEDTSNVPVVGTLNRVSVGVRKFSGEDTYFNDAIDNAFVYASALSAAEIAWLYNSGSGRSFLDIRDTVDANNPGVPDAYWSLKEVAGAQRKDWSSNAYHLAESASGPVARVAALI